MNYNIGLKSQLDTRELLLLDQEVKDRGKNMVIAYVLWYFLGLFGGHRFYMGRTGSAVAQLILSITVIGMIVTFIWWVVDAFTLHNMVKERNYEVENQVIHSIMMSRPPGPGVY
ncbi:TM2 domain-containing protein [Paenibacillus aquistagni]|uniref:TM2 domain-containing protein n=1 Tax=Paenibacillus aquistagni TaxID=1852522 RepID=A0A1X7K4M3_9BACL|nr:TM2 domain-containing protein [Paenibacillus aquistagni]NMM54019.1 TM2 domain-containing protein [Paenibacillus aquistagni]SMG35873.1 TM2 domain-containing protein [Paenibacillus aquistagni]